MGEKNATLVVTLKDLASTALGRLVGSFEKFKVMLNSIMSVVNPFMQFLVDSVKSYAESESAIARLNNALKNQGIYSAQLSEEMQDYAKQLQTTTIHSDETNLQTMTLLTTFGLAGKQMKDATEAAMNLSAGIGIDLQSATMLIGKAFTGSTETLARYGIKIKEGIPEGEKFAAVMAQITEKFGGRAQTEMTTLAGKLQYLKNQWDEFSESVGSFAIPILDRAFQSVNNLIDLFRNFGGTMDALKAMFALGISDMVVALAAFIEQTPILGTMMKFMGMDIDEIRIKMNDWALTFQMTEYQSSKTTKKLLDNQKLVTKSAKEQHAQQTKEFLTKWKADMEATSKYNADVLVKENERIVAMKGLQATEYAARLSAMESAFATISSLQNSHVHALFAVGKAAAVAGAIVSTHRGAAGALEIPPPWLGIALATMIEVAGMLQVAQIMGVQFAEGGIVMPRPGGTLATIGEAGSAEAVIPLEADKLAELGIGGTTINISAGVLVGSQDSVKELAKMIDQELFRMVKNKQSVAFGALT